MTRPRFVDIVNVETEHLVGATLDRPLVTLRVSCSEGIIGLAQMPPDQARDIASHLFESAARAEYDYDVVLACKAAGDEKVTSLILHLVRSGELLRHQPPTQDGAE
jgi:hypothetical protein